MEVCIWAEGLGGGLVSINHQNAGGLWPRRITVNWLVGWLAAPPTPPALNSPQPTRLHARTHMHVPSVFSSIHPPLLFFPVCIDSLFRSFGFRFFHHLASLVPAFLHSFSSRSFTGTHMHTDMHMHVHVQASVRRTVQSFHALASAGD